ncbi:MAG: hypothetical protein QXI58_05685 [Candidatus Micrarchaeia archaeon]
MIDKGIFILTIIVVFILGFFIFSVFESKVDEKFCLRDEDCACGTKINTGECFVGNKKYVNTEVQCPDFCTGIAGNFVTKCISNKCQLVMKG